jgi:hypothetical protein
MLITLYKNRNQLGSLQKKKEKKNWELPNIGFYTYSIRVGEILCLHVDIIPLFTLKE